MLKQQTSLPHVSCMYILLNTGRKQLLSTLNITLYVHASEYKHLQTLLFSLYFANIFNMMDFNFLSGKQHCWLEEILLRKIYVSSFLRAIFMLFMLLISFHICKPWGFIELYAVFQEMLGASLAAWWHLVPRQASGARFGTLFMCLCYSTCSRFSWSCSSIHRYHTMWYSC